MNALRAAGVREVGITLNLDRNVPATESDADLAAVVRADTQHNLVWTEPLLAGALPGHRGGDLGRADHRRRTSAARATWS